MRTGVVAASLVKRDAKNPVYYTLLGIARAGQQNLSEAESAFRAALAINPDAKPEWRLVNLVMQRRARWLLSRIDELFLTPGKE